MDATGRFHVIPLILPDPNLRLGATMSGDRSRHLRLVGTALALLAELIHLAWEHFHGGILRHHILNRSDLPAISNGWGIVLLPALTWYLMGRISRRSVPSADGRPGALPRSVMVGFAGALLFGLMLSGGFALRQTTLTAVLFQGLLLLALLLPVYRAECVLGFVLGMTFVFGVVLPTAIASIIAALSMLLHRVVYPFLVRLWVGMKRVGSPPT